MPSKYKKKYKIQSGYNVGQIEVSFVSTRRDLSFRDTETQILKTQTSGSK